MLAFSAALPFSAQDGDKQNGAPPRDQDVHSEGPEEKGVAGSKTQEPRQSEQASVEMGPLAQAT